MNIDLSRCVQPSYLSAIQSSVTKPRLEWKISRVSFLCHENEYYCPWVYREYDKDGSSHVHVHVRKNAILCVKVLHVHVHVFVFENGIFYQSIDMYTVELRLNHSLNPAVCLSYIGSEVIFFLLLFNCCVGVENVCTRSAVIGHWPLVQLQSLCYAWTVCTNW